MMARPADKKFEEKIEDAQKPPDEPAPVRKQVSNKLDTAGEANNNDDEKESDTLTEQSAKFKDTNLASADVVMDLKTKQRPIFDIEFMGDAKTPQVTSKKDIIKKEVKVASLECGVNFAKDSS